MNLLDIHTLIAGSTPDSWYRLREPVPTYRHRFEQDHGLTPTFPAVVREHHQHAVFRDEPSLTMSWGMSPIRAEVPDFGLGKFTDPTHLPFLVDFFWNNALIDRVRLTVVDTGRGIIPIPDWNLEVTAFEEKVAHLIHQLVHVDGVDTATLLQQIDATVVEDRNRLGAGSKRANRRQPKR